MTDHPAVVFLRNAHQRAEELARAATPGPWEAEGDDPTGDEIYTCHDGEHGDLLGEMVAFTRGPKSHPTMLLIADAADPAAVMRRIEAERAVLEACDTAIVGWYYGETKELAHDVIAGLARGWGWTEEQHD